MLSGQNHFLKINLSPLFSSSSSSRALEKSRIGTDGRARVIVIVNDFVQMASNLWPWRFNERKRLGELCVMCVDVVSPPADARDLLA